MVRDDVLKYLRGLSWDGRDHIHALAHQGSDDGRVFQQDVDVAAAFRRFFHGAVRRILQPGCKVDKTLVLTGRMGVGKSTFVRDVCPDLEWRVQYHGVPSAEGGREADRVSRDVLMLASDSWIGELPADDFLWPGDIEDLKVFAAQTTLTFRPPYARKFERHARSSVFVVTSPPPGFSGGRRYDVVTVIRPASVVPHRDQLWAQAIAEVEGGGA